MIASMKWMKAMEFQCTNGDHLVTIDATKEHGGNNLGPSPKELLLNAMMGCTGMDVVSILSKMRQVIENFSMEIETVNTQEHPVHFKTALLKFYFSGNLEKEKIEKAVDLSLSKYCGVNFIVSKSCDMSYQIHLNRELITTNTVKFVT